MQLLSHHSFLPQCIGKTAGKGVPYCLLTWLINSTRKTDMQRYSRRSMPAKSESCQSLKEESRSLVKTDVSLVPIKLHYMLFFGGVGCVIPYVPLLAKELGISASAVGVIYTVLPFLVFFAKPAYGALADYFRSFKFLLIFLCIVTATSFSLLLLVPRIPRTWTPSPKEGILLRCSGNNVSAEPGSSICDRTYASETAVSDFLSVPPACRAAFSDCTCADGRRVVVVFESGNRSVWWLTDAPSSAQLNLTLSTRFVASSLSPHPYAIPVFNLYTATSNTSHKISLPEYLLADEIPCLTPPEEDKNFPPFSSLSGCNCTETPMYTISCKAGRSQCLIQENVEEILNPYGTAEFWIFSLLAVISGVSQASLLSLSDAGCYELLHDKPELFGRQRLWGTVSWGLTSILTGYLNDLASSNSSGHDYSPGFYLMLLLGIMDLLLILQMRFPKANFSTSICRDVGRIFVSFEIVCFSISVFIIGGLTGLLWNYQFWFLQDLGASQLLLGLTVSVQCYIGEIPLFIVAEHLIRAVGHFYCLVLTFAAYALRYVLYYFLKNPWYVLPIEVLHGQTYAVFYATLASYSQVKAPPGTEATMLGVLAGLFEGLGGAAGSFLSGLGFDYIGGACTFFIAAMLSLCCTVVLSLMKIVIKD